MRADYYSTLRYARLFTLAIEVTVYAINRNQRSTRAVILGDQQKKKITLEEKSCILVLKALTIVLFALVMNRHSTTFSSRTLSVFLLRTTARHQLLVTSSYVFSVQDDDPAPFGRIEHNDHEGPPLDRSRRVSTIRTGIPLILKFFFFRRNTKDVSSARASPLTNCVTGPLSFGLLMRSSPFSRLLRVGNVLAFGKAAGEKIPNTMGRLTRRNGA